MNFGLILDSFFELISCGLNLNCNPSLFHDRKIVRTHRSHFYWFKLILLCLSLKKYYQKDVVDLIFNSCFVTTPNTLLYCSLILELLTLWTNFLGLNPFLSLHITFLLSISWIVRLCLNNLLIVWKGGTLT